MTTIEDVLAIQDAAGFAVALSDLVCPRCYRDGFESLTAAERVVFCVDELEREINNGGFHQFFQNLSGDRVPETIAVLETVGAGEMLALLREAVALFPARMPPRDQLKRGAILEGVSEDVLVAWATLDDKFCSYPEDLTTLVRRYVEQHREEFRAS